MSDQSHANAFRMPLQSYAEQTQISKYSRFHFLPSSLDMDQTFPVFRSSE